jgi:hypothetical protein
MDRIRAVATVKDWSVKWFGHSERGSLRRGAMASSLDFASPEIPAEPTVQGPREGPSAFGPQASTYFHDS